MNNYAKWLDLKSAKELIEKEILDIEIALYNENIEALNAKASGTIHCDADGYRLTVIKRDNVKVDQKLAAAIEIGFKKKYEFSATEFKALNDEQKKLVESAITSTPGKPTFKVEKL